MNSSQTNSKGMSKQMEYAKQQEQLRALGNLRNSGAKPLSADSMIEDLLSKKETFQKRGPELQQKQEANGWLCSPVPPMYSQVWASVQSANGLADTPVLSTLLMSSGLSTDTLAYIWSLANRTVPGALIQQEVYLVLALIALTQSGYHITNLTTVLQLPQAPIPSLDLALLPTPRQQVYPSPLSVTTLPDSHTYNWVAPEAQLPNVTDKIGVSYVSSGPMISPKLLTETPTKSTDFSFSDFNIKSGIEVHNDSVPIPSLNLGCVSKTTSTKHFGSAYTFSFPSLSESPSHVASVKSEEADSFDDEFTDFQSADFTSVPNDESEIKKSNGVEDDDDEFTNFQKASPKFEDDLSVLVIDGKNIPSAQTLWVADTPISSKNQKKEITGNNVMFNNMSETESQASKMKIGEIKEKVVEQKENKYDAFQVIDDDKFSVFYNPLPEDEDKHSGLRESVNENARLETKSIFSHSLFSDPEPSLDLFKKDVQPVVMDFSKSSAQSYQMSSDIPKGVIESDNEEFSNFQNFPVCFPDFNASGPAGNVDRYDVFRTIVFVDNNSEPGPGHVSKAEETENGNSSQTQPFKADTDASETAGNNKKETESDIFGSFMNKQNNCVKFTDFQESVVRSSTNGVNNMDNLFSSLAISDKTSDKDPKNNSTPDIGFVEDKYKALRLLEDNSNEGDEFGEFLGADVPNFGNQPLKAAEKPSIQVRCLEACLNLLKDGFTTLSRASSQEVVSEVLSDPRASTYLDCLLEVHRVSERIINNMETDTCAMTKAELCRVWESLAPYFTHTEHNHLSETVGGLCGVCRSNTGPSPVTFGAMTFHSPCANLYLHCVEPVLPNIGSTSLVSS